MTTIKASDLPPGSIVGSRFDALFRDDTDPDEPWSSTDGSRYSHVSVSRSLRDGDAEVLREGFGTEARDG